MSVLLAFASCAANMSGETVTTDCWNSQLSREITVEGIAYNAKMGALLETDDKEIIWIDSIDSWPDDYFGKRIKVTGVVIERYDLPVYIQKEGNPVSSGIPVPEGTDLHEASRRYLLKDAKWELVR